MTDKINLIKELPLRKENDPFICNIPPDKIPCKGNPKIGECEACLNKRFEEILDRQ